MAKKQQPKDLVVAPEGVTLAHLNEFDAAARMEEEAKALVIADQAAFDLAGRALAAARGMYDALEEEEAKATGPANTALKQIRTWFRPAKDRLKQIQETLNHKMTHYALEDMARVSTLVEPARVSAEGMTLAKVWKGRVVNKAALIKAVAAGEIPDTMLAVDLQALNRTAQATAGGLKWAGVEWYEDVQFRRKSG